MTDVLIVTQARLLGETLEKMYNQNKLETKLVSDLSEYQGPKPLLTIAEVDDTEISSKIEEYAKNKLVIGIGDFEYPTKNFPTVEKSKFIEHFLYL